MDNSWNRREFVQISSMLAGLGVAAGTATATGSPGPAKSLAGAISSVTLVDDVVRLSGVAPGVAETVSGPLNRERDFVRLGALAPGAEQAVALIDAFKPVAASGKATRSEEAKLALGTGWIIHHALEKRVAKVVKSLSGAEAVECRIYHDAALLREVTLARPAPYADGGGTPFAAASVEEIESIFQLMGKRRLIAMHTFIPDGDDVDGWIRRLYAWRSEIDDLFKRYAAAYRSPDAAKWKRYVDGPGFYAAKNPLIRLCRSFQKGGIAPAREIAAAVESREDSSIYSDALGHSYRALRGITSYMEGKTGKDALVKSLEISA